MEGLAVIALVVGAIAFFLHRKSTDKRALQMVSGALDARAKLLSAQDRQAEADEVRRIWMVLYRAQLWATSDKKFRLEESEHQDLMRLTFLDDLQKLMGEYGSPHEAQAALSRLSRRIEKGRNKA